MKISSFGANYHRSVIGTNIATSQRSMQHVARITTSDCSSLRLPNVSW